MCVPNTKYFFERYFGETTDTELHYYCHRCEGYLGVDGLDDYECSFCHITYAREECFHSSKYFLVNPLRAQLRTLLQSTQLWQIIKREKQNAQSTVKGEITTGDLYHEANVQNFLKSGDNFTLTMYADGFNISKSSPLSLWPIMCSLNEVPFYLKPQFLLVHTIWSGVSKPCRTDTFLRPFQQEAVCLEREGVEWTDAKGCARISKVRVLLCVADAPARAMLTSSTQYNGEYGCGHCKHKGEQVVRGDGSARVYPMQYPLPGRRTHSQTIRYASRAVENPNRKSVKGIKGPSRLSLIPGLDIVYGLMVDPMHCSDLGISRTFYKLWTSDSDAPYYIGKPECLDEILLTFMLPDNIRRLSRSYVPKWKASEWRNFRNLYSPIALRNKLPTRYYNHWLLFVNAMRLISGKKVTSSDIQTSILLATKFIYEAENLYGTDNVSYNLHSLLHLIQAVRRWGASWAYSAYIFEDAGGFLKRLIHGTKCAPKQILHSLVMRNRLRTFSRKYIPSAEKPIFDFYSRLDSPIHSRCDEVSEVFPLGKAEKIQCSLRCQLILENYFNRDLTCTSAFSWTRLSYNGKIYSTTEYSSTLVYSTRPQKQFHCLSQKLKNC